eukprot:588827-Hanusia_phi.AAC.1
MKGKRGRGRTEGKARDKGRGNMLELAVMSLTRRLAALPIRSWDSSFAPPRASAATVNVPPSRPPTTCLHHHCLHVLQVVHLKGVLAAISRRSLARELQQNQVVSDEHRDRAKGRHHVLSQRELQPRGFLVEEVEGRTQLDTVAANSSDGQRTGEATDLKRDCLQKTYKPRRARERATMSLRTSLRCPTVLVRTRERRMKSFCCP